MGDKIIKEPNIRFKGFTDIWEQRKLGDIVDVRSGRDYKHLSEGNIPVYGTGGYMLSVDGALSYEDDAIGIGRKGTIDKPYLLKAPFWTVDTLFYVLPKTNYNLEFIFDIYQKINWKAKDESTGVPSLSKTAINSVGVKVPLYQEQKKIGGFFREIDNLLNFHQRKLELLKTTKKTMLQKMFPKDGENVPEIRFKGFTDAWEQRKLSDVAKYRNGKAHEHDINENGGYIVVNSKFVSTNGMVKKFSNKLIEPLRSGEIVFVLSDVPNGKALARTFLIDVDKMYSLNQRIAGITPHKGIDSYFLNILMNRNDYFLKFDNGVGQTNLSKSEVNSFLEFYPCYEEQVKIGEYFNILNNIINLHQRELELLKNLKKSMIQQMFI